MSDGYPLETLKLSWEPVLYKTRWVDSVSDIPDWDVSRGYKLTYFSSDGHVPLAEAHRVKVINTSPNWPLPSGEDPYAQDRLVRFSSDWIFAEKLRLPSLRHDDGTVLDKIGSLVRHRELGDLEADHKTRQKIHGLFKTYGQLWSNFEAPDIDSLRSVMQEGFYCEDETHFYNNTAAQWLCEAFYVNAVREAIDHLNWFQNPVDFYGFLIEKEGEWSLANEHGLWLCYSPWHHLILYCKKLVPFLKRLTPLDVRFLMFQKLRAVLCRRMGDFSLLPDSSLSSHNNGGLAGQQKFFIN